MQNQPIQPAPASPGQAGSSPRPTKVKEQTDLAYPADEAFPVPSDQAELASTRVVDITPFEADNRAQRNDPIGSSILPTPGETLGDFRLFEKIGEGAMGAVYKGHQTSLNREVAVKVLFKHVARNAKLVDRFYREARVTGRLNHANIVQGYAVDESQGWHYFAMEYVDGESLQEWLGRLGKLSVGDALCITIAVARALQYAHENNLVHRDIKPANILITRHGQIKLADLGMVKLCDEDMGLTQTGHGVGTPWYMPLEQARNAKETDGRCDIYALGCMLYCMLTGQPPFTQPTLVEVIQAKEIGTFPPARRTNPEVPEHLDLIILRMTQKRPQNRYDSCADLIKGLEGMCLAHKRLRFLDPQTGPVARAAAAATPPVPAPSTPPSVHAPTLPAREISPDLWYVRYRTREGRLIQRKMRTAEVLAMIEAPDFDQEATASRRSKEGFRALAAHREFEHVMLGRVSKTGLDQQTSKYRAMYRKLEEQDRQRRQVEEEVPVTTATYWWAIFVRVAVVVGVVGGGYLLIKFMIENLRGIFF